MNRDKQIEEMARTMCRNYKQDGNCASDDEPCALECIYGYCSERIYCAGYRKADDVAAEIFEEIEREIKNHGICYAQRKIAELKKKYTEEGK